MLVVIPAEKVLAKNTAHSTVWERRETVRSLPAARKELSGPHQRSRTEIGQTSSVSAVRCKRRRRQMWLRHETNAR
jgi:hypothetical protein